MTHSYLSHDSFICDMTHWHMWLTYVTWLTHIRDITRSYVTCPKYRSTTCLLGFVCDMTHSNMWHDSFIFVTWLIYVRDMTHSHMWHDSLIYMIRLIHMWHAPSAARRLACCSSFVTWRIHICDMTHSYSTRLIRICNRTLSYGSYGPIWQSPVTCHMVPYDSLIQMWHSISIHYMTQSYTWHDSFVHYMTNSCMWHDSFTCDMPQVPLDDLPLVLMCDMTCFVHICDMPHIYMWRSSFIYATCLTHVSGIPQSYIARMNESCSVCDSELEDLAKAVKFERVVATYERVMSHMWASHVSHEQVMSHVWLRARRPGKSSLCSQCGLPSAR